MKSGIHPTYYEDALVVCACGNTWRTGSTKKEIHTDVCSKCHPFYTGEQRIVDTAGQVERFMKRANLAEQRKTETEARPSKKQRRAQARAARSGIEPGEPEVINPEEVAGGPVELTEVPTPTDQATAAPETVSPEAAAAEAQNLGTQGGAQQERRRNRPPRPRQGEGDRPRGPRPPRPPRQPRAEQSNEAAAQASPAAPEASEPGPEANNQPPAEPAAPPAETPNE